MEMKYMAMGEISVPVHISYSDANPLTGASNAGGDEKIAIFSTNISCYLGNDIK